MVRPDLAAIEKTAQQGVPRPFDRMQRTGAVEGVSEARRLKIAAPAAADFHFKTLRHLACGNHTSGDDFQPALPDQPRDGRCDLGRDPVTVNIPPGAGVTNEATLLLRPEALPKRLTVRPQAIDCGAPADLGAAPTQPPPKRPNASLWHLSLVNGSGVEIRVGARRKPSS